MRAPVERTNARAPAGLHAAVEQPVDLPRTRRVVAAPVAVPDPDRLPVREGTTVANGVGASTPPAAAAR